MLISYIFAHLQAYNFVCDCTIAQAIFFPQQKKSRYVGGEVNFDRPWTDYVNGFGYLDVSGEFWLGLNNLHHFCSVSAKYLYLLIRLGLLKITHRLDY